MKKLAKSKGKNNLANMQFKKNQRLLIFVSFERNLSLFLLLMILFFTILVGVSWPFWFLLIEHVGVL